MPLKFYWSYHGVWQWPLLRACWSNLLFIYLFIHFTVQDLLPRGKGHNRTSRSLPRCPTSPTPHIYERQSQNRDHPTLIRIVRGFFNVPQNYETGPPVYHPYPRRLESLTICRWNYKGSTFLLSYLKILSVGPVGVSNSRPPASQPGAQPSEQPVRPPASHPGAQPSEQPVRGFARFRWFAK